VVHMRELAARAERGEREEEEEEDVVVGSVRSAVEMPSTPVSHGGGPVVKTQEYRNLRPEGVVTNGVLDGMGESNNNTRLGRVERAAEEEEEEAGAVYVCVVVSLCLSLSLWHSRGQSNSGEGLKEDGDRAGPTVASTHYRGVKEEGTVEGLSPTDD
jgi:hypothetical protein